MRSALVGDLRGDLWVGTYNEGLCCVSGSRLSCWTTKDGLADDSARSLFQDDEHNLWVGLAGGGLTRWRIATLIPLRDEPRALREVQPAAILEDHSGNLWIGTGGTDRSALSREPTDAWLCWKFCGDPNPRGRCLLAMSG